MDLILPATGHSWVHSYIIAGLHSQYGPSGVLQGTNGSIL